MQQHIINLTPHDVVVGEPHPGGGWREVKRYPPSGFVARVSFEDARVDEINGVPLYEIKFGEPHLLDGKGNSHPFPEPRSGVYYIVSGRLKSALPERDDLLVPHTGRAYRDETGRIVAVPGFTR